MSTQKGSDSSAPKRSMGAGRLLIVFYAVFAVSATARASFQILTKFEEAPLAYSLSLVSALVYILATVSLARKGEMWKSIALGSVIFELVGVLAVGSLSFAAPELFAHPSVWSGFGSGYGYIPLVLPIVGLLWIRKTNKDS
jgi:cytochrome bd-type quinol oxidase subunit 2